MYKLYQSDKVNDEEHFIQSVIHDTQWVARALANKASENAWTPRAAEI